MSEKFDKCWGITLGNEGGYTVDDGGPTRWGVTEAVARKWGYVGPMGALPEETAKTIAQAEYWNAFLCEQLDAAVAFQVFDTAYNGGHPIQWLQEIANTKESGNNLAELVNAMDSWKVVALFNAKRLEYLASLKQPTYADGRMNRIANNMTKGGALL